MAKTVEVDLEVKSNLEPTIKNLRELKKQLRETAAGSKEFDKLSASIRDMEDAIGDAKATNDDFLGQLENASGPLGTLGQGIRAAERTFSSFNGALKASIIGIIVAAVAGLAAAFNNNEKATKKLQPLLDGMEKIFAGIFAVVEPLFNAIIDFAVANLPTIMKGIGGFYSALVGLFSFVKEAGGSYLKIWKGILTLDFDLAKEGVEQLKNSFATAVKAGTDAYKRFTDASKGATKAEKEEAAKRAEEAKKAAEENKKHQEEITAKNKAEYEKRLAAQKEADAKAKEQREKAAQEERDFFIGIENVNREKRIADALEKEATDEKTLSDATALVDALEAQDEKRTANEKLTADARNKIAQEEFQARQQLLGATADGLSVLSDLMGKETGKGKALAVAASLINTYAAIAGQLRAFSGVPIPGFAIVQAIATGLSGFAAVKNILKVQVPNSGGGGASVPSGGVGSAPASVTPAAPQFNVVGTSGQNQIAQSLGNQAPVKAFVVSNDVTTAQSLDRNIVKTATIG
jgi:flagellar biosynthesis GTPase FlhF